MLASLVLLAALAVAAAAGAATAPQAVPTPSERLAIPAQPLNEALDAYAAATGLQMLYDASLAAGRRSSPVAGAPNLRAGLNLLLQGTGLSARFTGGGAVVIYADASTVVLNPITAAAAPVIGRAAPDAAALAYVDRVQADLIRMVRDDDLLSSETYRLSIALRIAGTGVVEQAQILRGSSVADIDRRLLEVVVGAPLSERPPEGMPQPLRVELVVRQQKP